jgi:tRNA-(ms[2]io[6]A)-hydroxylase
MIHQLLVAALIEARSCERFRLLSENIADNELAVFYRALMVTVANHYTMFLKFAREYGDRAEVDQKWEDLLQYEAELMKELGKKETVHG